MVQLGGPTGAIMSDAMGTFRVDVAIENPARQGARRLLEAVLVDTGAELSWVPAALLQSLGVQRNNQWRFRQADGTILERWTGSVVIVLGGKRAGDEVVFGEPGDLVLLGSRSLEGLNLRVEPTTRRLVDAGPAPAAAAAREGAYPRPWGACAALGEGCAGLGEACTRLGEGCARLGEARMGLGEACAGLGEPRARVGGACAGSGGACRRPVQAYKWLL
jgi:predicted aspartyl protease